MIIEGLLWLCGCPCIVLVGIILTLVSLYMRKTYSFWTSRGVHGPTPTWGIGNMYARLRPTHAMAQYDQMLYEQHGGKVFCGYYEFTRPCLMVGDPDLLKHVMVKDFDHFTDRSFVTFNEPVMDHMLLGLKGGVWKAVRSVMTPTFSSGKIKQTLQLVKDCAANLVTYFNQELDNSTRSSFEMKEVYGMFTMDSIASIAFGVSTDSLNNTQDEFSAAAAKFFSPVAAWKRPMMFLQFLWPQIARRLHLNVIDRAPMHFFSKVVSDTMQYRLEKKLRRSDFLQLLLDAQQIEANNNNKLLQDALPPKKVSEQVLTELVITAQCVLFYIAGYDTTATTLSFVSYCLALHPGVQQRCMAEVEEVLARHEGQVTYEALSEMTYLDMVFAETLRLYPPAPRVDRTVTKPYTLPGTSFTLHKGMKVTIPIYSIHHDPKHWPDPEKFDPERFTPENKAARSQMLWLPFGSGPRNCIGMRFALMEAKVAIVYLLQDFAFIPSKKTQVPIALEKRSGLLKAEDGVWIRLAKRI